MLSICSLKKAFEFWKFIIVLSLFTALVACGGGGGGGGSNNNSGGGGSGSGSNEITTDFPGGTVADLQALSPSLTFDNLMINGDLILPSASFPSTTLNVNKLTLAAGIRILGKGSDLEIIATAEAVVLGSIDLTRVRTACNGLSGGNLSISAPLIEVSDSIRAFGGQGGIDFVGGNAFGCAGGNAGTIRFEGNNVTLTGVDFISRGGQGGRASGGDGADGRDGAIDLLAAEKLTILNSSVSTDGLMTLTADETDIFANLEYGTLSELIGNQSDVLPPTITIQSPASNSSIDPDQPLDVVINVTDEGSGVRDGTVTFGGNAVVAFNRDNFDPATGLVTVTIAQPLLPPASLAVSAIDNKNNMASERVTGLTFSGPTQPIDIDEIEPNNNFTDSQLVFINSTITGSFDNSDVGTIANPFNATTFIEDVYRLEGGLVAESFDLELTSDAGLGPDLELFVIQDNGIFAPTFPASSNNVGAGVTESITGLALAPGAVRYIGVLQLPPTFVSWGYTLKITPN